MFKKSALTSILYKLPSASTAVFFLPKLASIPESPFICADSLARSSTSICFNFSIVLYADGALSFIHFTALFARICPVPLRILSAAKNNCSVSDTGP